MSEKITNLLKQKYGLSKIDKRLSLTPKDDLFSAYRKLARYLYNNAYKNNDLTENDDKHAITEMLSYDLGSNYHVDKIEKLNSFDFNKKEIQSLYQAYKFKDIATDKKHAKDTNTWLDHSYLVTTTQELEPRGTFNTINKNEVVIIDPHNTNLKNHDTGAQWSRSFQGSPGINDWITTKNHGWRIYNADLLIGYNKIFKDLRKSPQYKSLDKSTVRTLERIIPRLQIKKKISNTYFQPNPIAELIYKKGKKIKNTDIYKYIDGQGREFTDSRNNIESAHNKNKALLFLSNYLTDTYNLTLQQEYEANLSPTKHAKFYQEKKYIKQETRQEMSRLSSLLENTFKGVEIDNDVDLSKLNKLIPELSKTSSILPKTKNKPILRFRKLKNHKALGLFTPINNTLAIDFRDSEEESGLQSFIHEYGHNLDFNSNLSNSPNLSLSNEFKPILNATQEKIKQSSLNTKTKNYLSAPTEIFARSFELYISDKGLNNSLIKSPQKYNNPNSDRYRHFDENIRYRINKYFDKTFPELTRNLENLNKSNIDYDVTMHHIGLANQEMAGNKLKKILLDQSLLSKRDKGVGISWFDKIDSQNRQLLLLPKSPSTPTNTLLLKAGNKEDNLETVYSKVTIPNSSLKAKKNILSISTNDVLGTLNYLTKDNSINQNINLAFRSRGKAISSKFVNKKVFNSNKGIKQQQVNLNAEVFDGLDL